MDNLNNCFSSCPDSRSGMSEIFSAVISSSSSATTYAAGILFRWFLDRLPRINSDAAPARLCPTFDVALNTFLRCGLSWMAGSNRDDEKSLASGVDAGRMYSAFLRFWSIKYKVRFKAVSVKPIWAAF